ncbi:hypothetical protein WN51_13199 [Melipona quadrifasciata]|uniref:Methyltransferase domain-containing protein n=1 Tax=Melipona quadrifasciata TaxID=166423 RepID=A0A0M9A3W0_9HYME|nr:hypothetical protein WN51_13199 [Melipona quadrifasciata]
MTLTNEERIKSRYIPAFYQKSTSINRCSWLMRLTTTEFIHHCTRLDFVLNTNMATSMRFCKTKSQKEAWYPEDRRVGSKASTPPNSQVALDGSSTPQLEGRSSLHGFGETEMASNGSDEGNQAGPKSGPGRLGNGRIVGYRGGSPSGSAQGWPKYSPIRPSCLLVESSPREVLFSGFAVKWCRTENSPAASRPILWSRLKVQFRLGKRNDGEKRKEERKEKQRRCPGKNREVWVVDNATARLDLRTIAKSQKKRGHSCRVQMYHPNKPAATSFPLSSWNHFVHLVRSRFGPSPSNFDVLNTHSEHSAIHLVIDITETIDMNMVEEYVNASTSQYRDAFDLIEEFKKEISEMKGKCIDIGCGPGDVSRRLVLPKLSPEAELVGADISKAMIDHARQKYQNEKRLSFLQLDIETPILPNEELEQRAFDNICKLLDASRFVPFFHRCKDSQATLKKMLEDTGFEILQCSRRERSFVYQNMEILKRHVIAVNPFISRIPDHLKEEFEDVVLREVASQKILIPNKNDDGQQGYNYHCFPPELKSAHQSSPSQIQQPSFLPVPFMEDGNSLRNVIAINRHKLKEMVTRRIISSGWTSRTMFERTCLTP